MMANLVLLLLAAGNGSWGSVPNGLRTATLSVRPATVHYPVSDEILYVENDNNIS